MKFAERETSMENIQGFENGPDGFSSTTSSGHGVSQSSKNAADRENISADLTELLTKAKDTKEQTGTITQIISGAFLGISIVFITTIAQMDRSMSLNIAFVLFTLCMPIFGLQSLLSSFKIENYLGSKKPFENLIYLFPLGYLFTFIGIFLFLLHTLHSAAIIFVLSPILILIYLFLIARIQKWRREWKRKQSSVSGAKGDHDAVSRFKGTEGDGTFR